MFLIFDMYYCPVSKKSPVHLAENRYYPDSKPYLPENFVLFCIYFEKQYVLVFLKHKL